ncbi:hypothetical protein GCM10027596_11430 [Nocardioides korecus]
MQRSAGAVADQADREVDPDHVAVAVEVALAQPVAGDQPLGELLEQLQVPGQVLGVRDLLEGQGHQLVGRVAEHGREGLVDAAEAALQRDQGDPYGRVVDREAPALLGGGKGRQHPRIGRGRRRVPGPRTSTAAGVRGWATAQRHE